MASAPEVRFRFALAKRSLVLTRLLAPEPPLPLALWLPRRVASDDCGASKSSSSKSTAFGAAFGAAFGGLGVRHAATAAAEGCAAAGSLGADGRLAGGACGGAAAGGSGGALAEAR
tara:strand:- start:487 stop:834 length:348 start_codon:yes stop_codon:yes gene_type:complete